MKINNYIDCYLVLFILNLNNNFNLKKMKILVCISNVPDTTSKINFTESNTQFDKNGITFIINPLGSALGIVKIIFISLKSFKTSKRILN